MMKMNLTRVLACLLTAVTLSGLLVTGTPADAASGSGFTDITDPTVADAAELLRLLDVVDGTGGTSFHPAGTLSRAEFCKMTVEIMGQGDQEPAHRSRTVFSDVGPSHWARGYINLASSINLGASAEGTGGTRLIMGVGDGTFQPQRPITYGEAVTILLRVLNYSNSDVAAGVPWYAGYVSLADAIGLSDGLTLSGDAVLTRGQAAVLFSNLLFASPKGSSDIYLSTLGGKKENGGILLDTDAVAADGTGGAVQTTTGTYKTDRAVLSASLEGMRGEIVLDKDGKLLAFLPDENLSRRSVSAAEWAYNRLTTSGGEKIDLKPDMTIYQDGQAKTYESVWQNLRPGTPVTLYYTAAGQVDYLFLTSAEAMDQTVMVAKSKPSGTVNPFKGLTGGVTDYAMYKNGVPATVADIRQYDVATYDAAAKIMNISDLRLTGVYENVYPNTDTPAKITVLGAELTVLPSAQNDLRSFKIGDQVTLLLTRDGQVAGAVTPSAAISTTVGVVTEISGGTATKRGSATVKLLGSTGLTLSGEVSTTEQGANRLRGQLVSVSSRTPGVLSLTQVSNKPSRQDLDVATRKLGSTELAPNVQIFEQVEGGAPVEIDLDQITCNTVDSSKILHAGTDYAGRINLLVLNNVTGDLYTYGFIHASSEAVTGSDGEAIGSNPLAIVETDGKTAEDGWKNENLELYGSMSITGEVPGGLAASPNTATGRKMLADYVTLTAVRGVSRSAFDLDAMTVTTTDMILPISKHVVCYNKDTDSWFAGDDPMAALELARAYSDTLTIYYDKAPDQGGKVRMVVAGG
jgi:hypothetical protein